MDLVNNGFFPAPATPSFILPHVAVVIHHLAWPVNVQRLRTRSRIRNLQTLLAQLKLILRSWPRWRCSQSQYAADQIFDRTSLSYFMTGIHEPNIIRVTATPRAYFAGFFCWSYGRTPMLLSGALSLP